MNSWKDKFREIEFYRNKGTKIKLRGHNISSPYFTSFLPLPRLNRSSPLQSLFEFIIHFIPPCNPNHLFSFIIWVITVFSWHCLIAKVLYCYITGFLQSGNNFKCCKMTCVITCKGLSDGVSYRSLDCLSYQNFISAPGAKSNFYRKTSCFGFVPESALRVRLKWGAYFILFTLKSRPKKLSNTKFPNPNRPNPN